MTDKAIIFPKGDVAALQKTLQDCCDHPEKVEKYKKTAADYICGKYDWDAVTRETLEHYQREQEEPQQVLQQVN